MKLPARLKTVAGKRDLGQCEVSRLLLSEPLYSSSFEYVVLPLDLKISREVNPIKQSTDEMAIATNDTIMDFFAKRHENPKLSNILHEISNLYFFCQKVKSL